MADEFTDRRRNTKPDYVVTIYITGVKIPHNKVNWQVKIDSDDYIVEELAAILESSASVLRDGGGNDHNEKPS